MLKNFGCLAQVGGESKTPSPTMLAVRPRPETLSSDQLFDLALTHLKYPDRSCGDAFSSDKSTLP